MAASPAPHAADAPVDTAATERTLATWTFPGNDANGSAGWTAERGRMTVADGKLQLRPDANRRMVLLSPPGLPEAAAAANRFAIAIAGTGLVRVRIQGRRDARGGWMTLADARGSALQPGRRRPS